MPEPWVSTSAKWKISDSIWPRKRLKRAARPIARSSIEDTDHLIAVRNERRAKRMPMLFSPTIGAAITAGYWFLWARCPACRTTGDVDLRTLDWAPRGGHHGPYPSTILPLPNAPFTELVCLSKLSVPRSIKRSEAAIGRSASDGEPE